MKKRFKRKLRQLKRKAVTAVKRAVMAALALAFTTVAAWLGCDMLSAEGLLPEKWVQVLHTSPPSHQVVQLAQVRVLDVGQGSSLLLRTADATVLVDGGDTGAGEGLVRALAALGCKRLDLVILTHAHADHFGGLIAVLDEIEVDTLWMPNTPKALLPTNRVFETFLDAVEQNGCSLELLDAPRRFDVAPQVTLQILDGFLKSPGSLNDTSLCLRIDAGNASFLVTGDAEQAVEEHLLLGGAPLDADILMAGHHGSATSSGLLFLNAVRPVATAISAGAGNSYGLPNQGVVQRLSLFGPVYRTDLSGVIIFDTDGNSIEAFAGGIGKSIAA